MTVRALLQCFAYPMDLHQLTRFLYEEHGLDLKGMPEPVVRARVDVIMRRLAVVTYSHLTARLQTDAAACLDALVDLTRPFRRLARGTNV